ncbi:MAG: septum site-determining protein MinC [Syntrophomonadaceae bacterium]
MSGTLTWSKQGMFIEVKHYQSFNELQTAIAAQLNNIDNNWPGTPVYLDIGSNFISNKQKQQIEDILLDQGLHLKEIISQSMVSENIPEEKPLIDDMPNYESTQLICRNFRSGQKVFSSGNIVILGDVNPGAEIIAVGNIMIMGSLRGMAHAGAEGDTKAIIAAYRLNPTQIRIAEHITRPPDGEQGVGVNPEVARIRAGKVIIERLKI